MHLADRPLPACALLATLALGCAPQATTAPAPLAPRLAAPAATPPMSPLVAPGGAVAPAVVPPAHASSSAGASASGLSSAEKTAAAALTGAANLVDDPLAVKLLAGGSSALKTVVATPEKYRFQVLYSVITPGPAPTLERHGYRADVEYYFPASSMKLPITLATFDRLGTLRKAGRAALTRDTPIRIYPLAGGAEPYVTSVARETWRALIVSDNVSANRLLGIVGHREAHETLWGLGLKSVRVRSGFATGAAVDPAEQSPRVEFGAPPGGKGDELPARRSDLALPANDAVKLDIGKANLVDGRRIDGPLSFADKNAVRMRELQDTLVRIMRPELLPGGAAADAASADDLAYLRHTLGTLPSESGLAGYDRNVVADYQLSPFLRGIERVRGRGKFQIFAKVGQAFGFLVANAYVVDKETGRSFFLTAAVYANPDEMMNDDDYAYDSISFPALADVGEAFCRHALGL